MNHTKIFLFLFLKVAQRCVSSTTTSTAGGESPSIVNPYKVKEESKGEKISKAMKAYMDRAKKHGRLFMCASGFLV